MKLRKLILSGFKSFADRTEFDFDEGISCVIGPNGCGKSNVVDAVKWVLGEQSAKSLRGSEMQDVIFNGSATRRPSGCAEVTLVFDEFPAALTPGGEQLTAGEVSIGRRLYRSGASEYLINKTTCRLRDVREMFMDTGVGADAYSLIEQGKVESFLQASQDDRRAVFDEAAGISKYKARKKEALHKLEKVQENLLRLNDILAEVEKRLRSIKHQAGKARNYQTYTERLKELRGLYFLAQYHELSVQRGELQKRLDAGNDSLAAISTMIDQLEAARSAAEVEAVDLERSSRQLQSTIAALSAQVLACQQRAEMLTSRATELGERIAAAASRREELEAKLETLEAELSGRRKELEQTRAKAAELETKHAELREQHAGGELAEAQLQARLEDEKAGTIDLFRRTAQIHNDIHASRARRESLDGQRDRLSSRGDQIVAALKEAAAERPAVQARLADVNEVLEESRRKLTDLREEGRKLADADQQSQSSLADAREQRSAVTSRMGALREMLDRLEGVGEGTRRLLAARRDGRLQSVCGMLGDYLTADLQHAPLVEAALAGADQQLIARRYADLQAEAGRIREVLTGNGAAEVLCLDRLAPLSSDFDVAACPAVRCRLIDWVRFDPLVAPAVWRILGATFVVDSLADAAKAAESAPFGSRFVTPGGEVLEPDGRVRLGSASKAAGVISRRSELADLAAQAEKLSEQIDELTRQRTAAQGRLAHLDQIAQGLRTANYEANTERVELTSRLAQLTEQISHLEREQPVVASDLQALAADVEAAAAAELAAKEKAHQLEQLNAQRQAEVDRLAKEIADARRSREQLAAAMTEVKVALAETAGRASSLTEACSVLSRNAEQMAADLQAAAAEIQLSSQRREEAQTSAAQAAAEVDSLYSRQQQLSAEEQEVEESRRLLQQRLEDIRAKLIEQRDKHRAASEAVNTCRVELGEADVRIENLIARASDEMNMDLLEAQRSYQHDDQRDWQAVAAEIQELREKIERLGNVNLDAIGEQEELTKRREFLAGQLADVTATQDRLNELIRRLNRESREMFTESFQAIRGHFQELFRKLFGGGRADIMLIDEQDVLESPIEIVARPPGKELRSLSLLSGGEKTMTALALLFSVFKARPSPFCLLDEVDAALDEANTQRFDRLMQEFVNTSQFIIISHAKRTMSMANVLYGVTMEELGVSKRISVRFEDGGRKLTAAEQLAPAEA